MAIGTITVVSYMAGEPGEALIKCSFVGDDAYPTGGTLKADIQTALLAAWTAEVAAATDKNVRGVKITTIKDVIRGECGQYVPIWDAAVGLKVRDGGSATLAEVGNGTDLKGTTFNATFICV